MATRLSLAQVNSWRLAAHHLAERGSPDELAQILSEVCGVQAQVLQAAELALRARIEGLRRQDVRNALWKNHAILKTWCMRGTLHLLASRDLPMYASALRTKLSETEAWLEKSEGITPGEVEAVTAEIRRALGDTTLTREELAKKIIGRVKLRPKTTRALMSAWGILLRPAAYQGALAFGPNQGPKVTFLRPRWNPAKRRKISTEEAFEELFRRFLGRYGPATVRDFGHWWGNLPESEAAKLKDFREEVEEVEANGRAALMLKRDAEVAASMEPVCVVRLLPSFDCYAMFYSPREAFVPAAHRSRIFRQTAGWNSPCLISDGAAAGVWNLRRRGSRVEVGVEAFRALSAREKQGVVEEAEDIGRYLGAQGTVRF